MRQVKLPSPPPMPPMAGVPAPFADYMRRVNEWLSKAALELNNASEENDRSTPFSYALTGTSTARLRTLNIDSATADDVRQFAWTLAYDLKRRGNLK